MGAHRLLGAGLAASLGLLAVRAPAAEPVPTGQGVAGGALVAGEITLLTEALLGVRPAWAYVLGATLAVAGGGYAGYLVERDADPEASAWLLGGGLALLIPTVIWVGNARETKPPARSGTNRTERQLPGRAASASGERARAPGPRAAIQATLGPLASERRDLPPAERHWEIHVPVLGGVF